jgi:diguanylate cyclase (GGDEF)-like protein
LLRRDELLARYGGEEFALIMSDTTPEQAGEAGERLRNAIAERPIETESGTLEVTVSAGAAATDRGTFTRPSELVDAADGRLYAAKQGGRSRVAF